MSDPYESHWDEVQQSGTFTAGSAKKVTRPESLDELTASFPTEKECRDYLGRLRWPVGFVCPRCYCREIPEESNGLLTCRHCRRLISPTTGTLLHLSPRPLRQWFRVIWEVSTRPSGTDVSHIRSALGLAGTDCVWEMYLETIRVAMRRAEPEELWGPVEVARCQAFIGDGQPVDVLIAVESRPETMGCIRLRRQLGHLTEEAEVIRFVSDVVEPSSTIRTSDWPGYTELSRMGFDQIPSLGLGRRKDRAIPWSQRVISLLRLWLWGIDDPGGRHLDHYLDEFVFRFNENYLSHHSPGALFVRLLGLIVQDSEISAQLNRKVG